MCIKNRKASRKFQKVYNFARIDKNTRNKKFVDMKSDKK